MLLLVIYHMLLSDWLLSVYIHTYIYIYKYIYVYVYIYDLFVMKSPAAYWLLPTIHARTNKHHAHKGNCVEGLGTVERLPPKHTRLNGTCAAGYACHTCCRHRHKLPPHRAQQSEQLCASPSIATNGVLYGRPHQGVTLSLPRLLEPKQQKEDIQVWTYTSRGDTDNVLQ